MMMEVPLVYFAESTTKEPKSYFLAMSKVKYFLISSSEMNNGT